MKSSDIKSVKHSDSDIVKILSGGVVLWETAKNYIVIGDRDGISADDMKIVLSTSDLNIKAITQDNYAGIVNYAEYAKIVNSYIALYRGHADFIIGTRDVWHAECIATEAKKRGIKTYHITEPEIKNKCDFDAYDKYAGMMEMVIDVEGIHNKLKAIRGK